MANISKAILDLLTNPKTRKFAESLKHSDLPAGWADDPEIVDLAAKAWQEAGTDSPFFKAWFGGSKAVGKDKAPSKYYHATTKDFDIFDAPAIESGYHARPAGLAFFTDKPSVADTYVRKEMLNAFSPEKWEDGANMMEVFLKLEKPIKVNARGSYWNDIPYKDDYLQTNDLGALAKESTKNDGVIIKNVRDEGRGRDWKNAEPLKSTVANRQGASGNLSFDAIEICGITMIYFKSSSGCKSFNKCSSPSYIVTISYPVFSFKKNNCEGYTAG